MGSWRSERGRTRRGAAGGVLRRAGSGGGARGEGRGTRAARRVGAGGAGQESRGGATASATPAESRRPSGRGPAAGPRLDSRYPRPALRPPRRRRRPPSSASASRAPPPAPRGTLRARSRAATSVSAPPTWAAPGASGLWRGPPHARNKGAPHRPRLRGRTGSAGGARGVGAARGLGPRRGLLSRVGGDSAPPPLVRPSSSLRAWLSAHTRQAAGGLGGLGGWHSRHRRGARRRRDGAEAGADGKGLDAASARLACPAKVSTTGAVPPRLGGSRVGRPDSRRGALVSDWTPPTPL